MTSKYVGARNNVEIVVDERAESNRKSRNMFREIFEKLLVHSMRKWKTGIDQHLIEKFLWPHASSAFTNSNGFEKSDLIVHDSYTCIHFKDKEPPDSHRPFPTRRNEDPSKINFISQCVGERSEHQISLEEHGTCPLICRPKEHPDWILC